jgi:surface antigen
MMALVIWVAFAASARYIFSTYQTKLPGQATAAQVAATKTTGQAPTSAAKAALATAAAPQPTANLTAAAPVQLLSSGPTGQLMPPGTMAPDNTYRNSYAKGQCTWYVASRRQVPSGWGNASSWYYNAISSGWSVGTVPAIAAIAWDPAYTNGAGGAGHVALVERVSDDGTQVYVSEMNYRGPYVKSFRWAPSTGFKYIY